MTDQGGEVEDVEGTLVSFTHCSWEKKPICVLLLTCVSRSVNLWRLPPLSIFLPIRYSLHHWLPSSYAYLLIMLQGFSLTGMVCREARWQCSRVKLHADGLYPYLLSSCFFLWVSQVLHFIQPFWFLSFGLKGLSELPLGELTYHLCNEDIDILCFGKNKYCLWHTPTICDIYFKSGQMTATQWLGNVSGLYGYVCMCVARQVVMRWWVPHSSSYWKAWQTADCEATSPVSPDCCFAFFIIRSAQACQAFLIEVFYTSGWHHHSI